MIKSVIKISQTPEIFGNIFKYILIMEICTSNYLPQRSAKHKIMLEILRTK